MALRKLLFRSLASNFQTLISSEFTKQAQRCFIDISYYDHQHQRNYSRRQVYGVGSQNDLDKTKAAIHTAIDSYPYAFKDLRKTY